MDLRWTSKRFEELDRRRRQCVTESEQLKAERNQATRRSASCGNPEQIRRNAQQAVRAMGERIAELDAEASKIDAEFRDVLARVPNIPHESVPVGEASTTMSKSGAGARRGV